MRLWIIAFTVLLKVASTTQAPVTDNQVQVETVKTSHETIPVQESALNMEEELRTGQNITMAMQVNTSDELAMLREFLKALHHHVQINGRPPFRMIISF